MTADELREFHEPLARSSLGCPNSQLCGHLLSDHDYDIADDSDDYRPINAVCHICECGRSQS